MINTTYTRTNLHTTRDAALQALAGTELRTVRSMQAEWDRLGTTGTIVELLRIELLADQVLTDIVRLPANGRGFIWVAHLETDEPTYWTAHTWALELEDLILAGAEAHGELRNRWVFRTHGSQATSRS